MKKYSTKSNIDASFKVTHASYLSSGYGHKRISVDILDENGNQKEFSSVTSNMHDFDETTDLEGQEKYEALFELIENDIEGEISGWIYFNNSKSKNTFYIAGYLNGNQVGVIDSDGKLNYSTNIDIDSWKHFETRESAQEFSDKLFEKEKDELHSEFKYEVEEFDEDYYSQENI